MNWTNVSLRSAKDIKAHEIAQPFVQGDMAILSFSSIHQNASELLSSLMNRGAPHDALDLERNSYFHHAAEFGRTKMLVILASYPDVELNSQNELGQTPVQIATEKGYVESVEFFLKRGIDASNEDAEGRTLLHRAAANEDAPMLELLLKYTQGLNELDDNGISPLSLAADRLNLDTITMLLDSDADVNSLVDDASTFFEAALVGILNTAQSKEAFTAEDETRVIDLTRRMLEMDADLTRRNAEGERPLHWVTDAHDTVYDGTDNDSLLSALTALLVEYDAPTSAENDDDVQALPLAHVIRHGYDQWLEQVIDANLASLNSITIEKTTLFQYAVEYGDAKTLAMLFDKGMKTKPWSPKSIDPLKYLIEKNDLATARILLEQGYAKPKESAIPIDGPLHLAARLNLAQMIELLLEFGYDVNVPGSRGNTPLHDAVTTKSTFAILTLVENDADPLIWNSDALTPMQRARDLGNPSVLDVLKRAVREKQSK
ncbi:MAG: ankyrin repeat domain-containing protein [Candidatus Hydrogenedentota bacterium]